MQLGAYADPPETVDGAANVMSMVAALKRKAQAQVARQPSQQNGKRQKIRKKQP